jgi:hypothetical protein
MTEIIHFDGKLQDYIKAREVGATAERERIVEAIKRNICFDALTDHDAMAPFRSEHPEVVGRCAHHGGKCTDLLLLVTKLEAGN